MVTEGRRPTGILGTSTFIKLRRVTDESALPHEPLITAITLAELSIGPLVAASDDVRAARQAHLQEAETDFDPVRFDADATRAFARLAASLRSAGRKPTGRSFDALVAATALAHQIPLFTCNARDFEGIGDLEVVPVPVDA